LCREDAKVPFIISSPVTYGALPQGRTIKLSLAGEGVDEVDGWYPILCIGKETGWIIKKPIF
jgi:hypothetical protein